MGLNKIRKNGKPWKLILIIAGIWIIAAGFSIHFVIGFNSKLEQYRESKTEYNSLASEFVSLQEDSESEPVFESDTEVFPVSVDFDSLLRQNPDIVGWIYNPDTVINYPIVQGSDNSYYLEHTINDTENCSGAIFADCSSLAFQNRSTVLYGHHMSNGSMFQSIVNYASQNYYDEHPVMYIATPEQNYKLEIFSCLVTNATSDEVYRFAFNDDTDYQNWLSMLCSSSKITSSVVPSVTDKVVILSTCSYEYDNARTVVVGVLMPISNFAGTVANDGFIYTGKDSADDGGNIIY